MHRTPRQRAGEIGGKIARALQKTDHDPIAAHAFSQPVRQGVHGRADFSGGDQHPGRLTIFLHETS